MSQRPSADKENSHDLAAIAYGVYEDWRSKRHAAALERHNRKKAEKAWRAKKNEGALALGSLQGGAQNGCPDASSFVAGAVAKAKKALKSVISRARKIHPGRALLSFALFATLLGAGASLMTLSASVWNAQESWVSVSQEGGTVALGDEQFSQNGLGLIEKTRFFSGSGYYEKKMDSSHCLASGACQSVDLSVKDWWKWRWTGAPPPQLAHLGWKNAGPLPLLNMLISAIAEGLALGCAIIWLLAFARAQKSARERGSRHAMGNILHSVEGMGAISLMFIATAVLLLLAGDLQSLIEMDKDRGGASPSIESMAAVTQGLIKPEQADWVQAGDPRGWGLLDAEHFAIAEACVEKGFCVPKKEDESAAPVSSEARKHRATALALAKRDNQIRYAPSFLLAGAAFFAWTLMCCFSADHTATNPHWVEKLDGWAARGRPRMERAQLRTQVRLAKKEARRGEAEPLQKMNEAAPKRRPRSL